MLVFPQLSSGAAAQFPLRRETGYRTLVNVLPDGSEIRVADLDYFERQWELPLELLTDAEWQAIEDLFAATEGRLQSFLFLEPGENLLAWSEKFTEDIWVKSGVTVSEGIDDPEGGTEASRISGGGTLAQTLSIPAVHRYAGSIWARTSAAGATLRVTDGGGQVQTAEFDTAGAWRRYEVSTAWTVDTGTVVFSVVAPGGGAVDLYGAQLEAQPFASQYKETHARGGVHPAARFGSDTLGDRLTGPGEHSGTIRIAWTPSQT
jgi:hypothetical protein